MSHPVSESDTYDASVVAPDVLDVDYPSSVPSAITSLANRTNYLANALNHDSGVLNNTNTSQSAATSFSVPNRSTIVSNFCYQIVSTVRFVRQYAWGATESPSFMYVPILPTVESDGVGFQVPGSTTFLGSPIFNTSIISSKALWYQNGTPVGVPALYWPVTGLPPNGKIIQFGVRLKGAAGHSGMPTTLPTISLYKQTYGVSSGTLIASVNDGSLNTTQYQAEHDLLATNLTIAIEANTCYFFKLSGESGTNKLTGLQILDSMVAIGA